MAQINKPDTYFNTKLYTGNGTTNAITGVGFQPDLVWMKRRDSAASHDWEDAVRGAGKYIRSDTTDAEVDGSGTFGITSFDSDGFSLTGSGGRTNSSGGTYASWNWLADNTTGSSNTDGSITSNVSANTTSGFSIVSFTGDGNTSTVGHGLGVAPKFFIIKNRSASGSWFTYTTVIDGSLDFLNLNDTSAKSDSGLSLPTTSVFSVNSSVAPNTNNIIAYCFAEKKGFSKFGSYTGNGNADGTFVYTGFKPAFVIIKRSSGIESWYTFDNKRDTSNVVSKGLVPNQNIAEFNADALDFTSNGFKIRVNAPNYNTSGDTYIYMAFAENPLVGTNNIPATAR